MTDEEYIQKCREWIARRKARLEQRKKQFEDQYPVMAPRVNQKRLEDLEALEFEIEFNEFELGGFIKDYLDSEEDEE